MRTLVLSDDQARVLERVLDQRIDRERHWRCAGCANGAHPRPTDKPVDSSELIALCDVRDQLQRPGTSS